MAIGLVRCLEESCKSTALKCWSATEIRWNKYIIIIRPRRSRSAAAYSHQTFPCTICRSVCLSVCLSVQCIVEKRQIAAGSRSAPYVGRVHGWGRYWGLAIGPPEGVLLGANLDRTIVTNGDFTAYVWDSASTVGAAVSGGACGGPRHCCIRWGST